MMMSLITFQHAQFQWRVPPPLWSLAQMSAQPETDVGTGCNTLHTPLALTLSHQRSQAYVMSWLNECQQSSKLVRESEGPPPPPQYCTIEARGCGQQNKAR